MIEMSRCRGGAPRERLRAIFWTAVKAFEVLTSPLEPRREDGDVPAPASGSTKKSLKQRPSYTRTAGHAI